MHPHCVYSGRPWFNLRHDVGTCREMLKGPGACERTVEYYVPERSMARLGAIDSAWLVIEPEYEWFYRSNDTKRSGRLCAVLNCAILIAENARSCAERCARKIIKLLHFDKSDIEETRTKVKSLITCSELIREISRQILEYEVFMKNPLQIKEKGNAREIILYVKIVDRVLKSQVGIFSREARMKPRTLEKQMLLDQLDTSILERWTVKYVKESCKRLQMA